jgi:hypothetical protein
MSCKTCRHQQCSARVQVLRSHKLDSVELSVANALSQNFDAAIRRQLAPIWNTIPQATHSLVRDIKTVQSLLTYLLRFNCVSFLRYLQCLRAAAGARTEWLLHSAANTVFQVCPCLAPLTGCTCLCWGCSGTLYCACTLTSHSPRLLLRMHAELASPFGRMHAELLTPFERDPAITTLSVICSSQR